MDPPLPNYITEWFPFTIEEVALAFEALGVSASDAERDARLLAQDLVEATERDEGYGLTEVGGFLDPVARLSEDAARRVAAFRAGRTFEPGGGAHDDEGV